MKQSLHLHHTSISGAVMYFSSPIAATVSLTSGVNATGENTATLPSRRRTNVPRPPTFILPNLAKGTERVVISGVTFRITMTSAGFDGISFEVMLTMRMLKLQCVVDPCSSRVEYSCVKLILLVPVCDTYLWIPLRDRFADRYVSKNKFAQAHLEFRWL